MRIGNKIVFGTVILFFASCMFNCGHGPEKSYTVEGSDIVMTIEWQKEKWNGRSYYRIYINDIDNPTNTDYIECIDNNTRDSTGPGIIFTNKRDRLEQSHDCIYIVDIMGVIVNINTPNFDTTYAPISYSTRSKDKRFANIKVIEWNRELYDSLYFATEMKWSFNNGDWDISVWTKNDGKIDPVKIEFNRNDKTSE